MVFTLVLSFPNLLVGSTNWSQPYSSSGRIMQANWGHTEANVFHQGNAQEKQKGKKMKEERPKDSGLEGRAGRLVILTLSAQEWPLEKVL